MTPADSPNSWDQFWYGDIWGNTYIGPTKPYRGLLMRTFSGTTNMAKVPDGTDVWFEGNQNSQTGTRRDYTSPALEPGYTYALNVKLTPPGGTTRAVRLHIHAGDNLFGLSYFDSAASENEIPAAGHIGCVAEVTETQALPDGRSNVLTVGVIRYQVDAYVERGDPYLVVRPNFFEDDEEDDASLSANSRDVASMFTRVANSIRLINDERGNLPDISDTEPQKLSFLVAAALEIEVETKQELLAYRGYR